MSDAVSEQSSDEPNRQRFLTLQDVADELNTSQNQIYALVRKGELEAVKIGGRGQWRVERRCLEGYVEQAYAETRAFIEKHPFDEAAAETDTGTELLAMSNPQPPTAAAGNSKRTPARRSSATEPERDVPAL